MKKLPETEYVYATARIHSVDGALLTRDDYLRLISAQDTAAFLSLLGEKGYDVKTEFYACLEERMERVFSFISEISPEKNMLSFMRYPYDCNNLKAAIKCLFAPGFKLEEIYSPCGSVSEKDVENAVAKRDFSCFPENMRCSAGEALDEYSSSRDPRMIDFILDKACYKDMLCKASETREQALIDYVKAKIDITNILTSLRSVRTGGGAALIRLASEDGGETDVSLLARCENEEELLSVIRKTEFGALFEGGFPEFSEAEAALDSYLIKKIKRFSHSVFGPGGLLGYICAYENEIKNIRIIASGRASGRDSAEITGRMRESYV